MLVLEPFLISGLTFAILQLLGNELSFIERLQSSKIGVAKILVPSCKNLPDKLSMPATLNGFKPFKMFNIFSEPISENSKFLFLNLILS